MDVLALLVRLWRAAELGMEIRLAHELWIMAVLSLGGPLDVSGPTKGKGKARSVEKSDEAKLAIVRVLLALMGPAEVEEEAPVVATDVDDDPLGEDIDWDADDPYPSVHPPAPPPPRPAFAPISPPLPILFHTLTTLLSNASTSTSLLALPLASLDALRILIEHYLVPHPPTKSQGISQLPTGPSPLLATALPGTASTLTRVALSLQNSQDVGTSSAYNFASTTSDQSRRMPSPLIVKSLALLSFLLVSTLADGTTASLRSTVAPAVTLEELSIAEPDESDVDPSPPVPLPPSTPAGPTLPTPGWLLHTLHHLKTILATLSTLVSHSSSTVRIALVDLLNDLLQHSPETLRLASATSSIIAVLLELSTDDWGTVSSRASTTLDTALSNKDDRPLLASIIGVQLRGLPRLLLRADENPLVKSSRIARAGLGVSRSTGGLEGIEKWCWSLVRAVSFDRIPEVGEQGMSIAWITTVGVDERAEVDWPVLGIKGVREGETRVELDALWKALGQSAVKLGKEAEVVELFLGIASGESSAAVKQSALWVLDGVLRGFEEGEPSKGRKKLLRVVVREILAVLDRAEEDEAEVEDTTPAGSEEVHDDRVLEGSATMDDVVSIQHTRGLTLVPSLDAYKPVSLAPSSAASDRVLIICLSLRLLSTTAALLASSFQPHLLLTLYHVLAYSSATAHPVVRSHAQIALSRIAYSTSYASAQNLVLANVDYVVNSVSQRLSVSRLDPSAPMVLVEMIRLVGEPIVPMVQDLVEDIFEALDDFHGYEEVTVGLWAVLDALMRVMGGQVREGEEETSVDTPRDEWDGFTSWFKARNDAPKDDDDDEEEDDDSPATNPRTPYVSSVQDPTPEEGPSEFPSKPAVPATRQETVAASILSKALYYLSHSSPFLRSRVLSLIASAIPLLATSTSVAIDGSSTNRQADLLPVIHRAWPYILNRIADTEPYVVLEAVSLIESLATHVGSFMSRRILDDVWPRFRTLLAKQEKLDRTSALTGLTPYTNSHRIYRAILSTMHHVAKDVPLKEGVVWEMAMLFRRFLDAGLEEELQAAARDVYGSLGRVNGDAVWLVLEGSVGGGGGNLPSFLQMDAVDLKANVDRIVTGM